MREDNNEFEAVTLSNIWIKEHILDIIKEINRNEIIAESGGLDIVAMGEMEALEILKVRIDALNQMKAYILQLRDNVAQYINKIKLIKIDYGLRGIDDHDSLLQNNIDYVSHSDNYYLSNDFQIKLKKLRRIKSILINGCGEAELLMPKRDEAVKGKKIEEEDEE